MTTTWNYHYLMMKISNERKFVNLKPVMKGVLKQLADPGFFAKVYVDEELGTVTWPGELDLDPDNLYAQGISEDEIEALSRLRRA